MKKPEKVLSVFDKYTKVVDKNIKQTIDDCSDLLMYQMMSYFMGYLDDNLQKTTSYGGKRFRPGLCLLFAEYYNCFDEAIDVATSLEIFHNFTLIHDDIADGDELRRGRQTVWSKWGINHGINTGDAQLILASKSLEGLLTRNPELGIRVQKFLNQKYLEVAEGQFLDFTYSELKISDSNITENNIIDMLGKKSGVLVGAATKSAGMIAGVSVKEQDQLWDFGYNLGLAYQLFDDIVSIWGNSDISGKDELRDIIDKKKTLPIIYLYNGSNKENSKILEKLYSKKGTLNDKEVETVKSLLDKSGTKEFVFKTAKKSVEAVMRSIENLSLDKDKKTKLIEITYALLPEAKEIML